MERDPIRRDGTRVAYGQPIQESVGAVAQPFGRVVHVDGAAVRAVDQPFGPAAHGRVPPPRSLRSLASVTDAVDEAQG